ncbi:MAG: hypothetical protein LC749_06820 [Actinobacteria bacterium]|nr:hypothetical protein [Actinomycetota bacterium]
MTSPPVGPPTPREQALAALAEELTPAKSLQRLDTATARVVSTISIVATLLTGLGLVTAGLTNLTETARVLAVVSGDCQRHSMTTQADKKPHRKIRAG